MTKLRVVLGAAIAALSATACADSPLTPSASTGGRVASAYLGTASVSTFGGNIAANACSDISIASVGALQGKFEVEEVDGVWTIVDAESFGDDAFAGIQLTLSADGKTLSFSANGLVYDVIVKGGNGGNHYAYANGQGSDQGLVSPLNNGGKVPTISHVNFCWTPASDEPMTSETAFASGGTPFSALGISRWGWTLPLANGTSDLIAGQNTKVGTVTVAGSTVTITTTAGYFISESHLYAGATQTPTRQECTGGKVKTCTQVATVAPGQYGLQTAHDPMVTTVTYTNVTGSHFIAHAVVWGNFGK
jgi:hypothetical protein